MNEKSLIRFCLLTWTFLFIFTNESGSQEMKFVPKTIISEKVVSDIINEISGTLPYNHIIELGAYNKDRKQEEYSGLYFESEYIIKKAKEYGFSDVHIEHFNKSSNQWDAEIGELWIIEPENRLFISCRDVPACLAPGSKTSDVIADLVYVGDGLDSSDYSSLNIEGKIILASGSIRSVSNFANQFGAVGVIAYGQPRSLDYPDQIVWNSIRVRDSASVKFGFNISPRLGDELTKLVRNEKSVKIRANVKTTSYKTDSEVSTALIPGDGTSTQEVVLCGHLFEGITKQGALDNHSGCAAILEAGRALIKLIEEGKLERPKRSIRFLWIPEISGTRLYLRRYPEEVKNIIAAINLDMVGEDVKKNHNSLILYRSPDSRASFLNDICQEFFEYVNISNRPRIHDRSWEKSVIPIVDPNGSRDTFYYNIERYYSASDHMVFQDREFGIPAVMFNNWPDMFYHSNEDRPDKCDPTQLKRAVFIALTSSYVIANAGIDDVPKLLSLVYGKGSVRIMKDFEKALKYLQMSSPYELKQRYKDVKNNLYGSYIREKINIESINVFTMENFTADEWISKMIKNLEDFEKETQKKMNGFYKLMCKKFGLSGNEPELTSDENYTSNITPVSTETGSKDISIRNNTSGLSRFSQFELANFIDSGLSVLDIKNSVSAQFGKVEIKDVLEYYKNLEARDIIDIVKK